MAEVWLPKSLSVASAEEMQRKMNIHWVKNNPNGFNINDYKVCCCTSNFFKSLGCLPLLALTSLSFLSVQQAVLPSPNLVWVASSTSIGHSLRRTHHHQQLVSTKSNAFINITEYRNRIQLLSCLNTACFTIQYTSTQDKIQVK